MTFDEWREKYGPNGGDYDIEMQRAGWDGRQGQVDELAMLIKRLAHQLQKTPLNNDLAGKAMDYLKRENLIGSPMRDV